MYIWGGFLCFSVLPLTFAATATCDQSDNAKLECFECSADSANAKCSNSSGSDLFSQWFSVKSNDAKINTTNR